MHRIRCAGKVSPTSLSRSLWHIEKTAICHKSYSFNIHFLVALSQILLYIEMTRHPTVHTVSSLERWASVQYETMFHDSIYLNRKHNPVVLLSFFFSRHTLLNLIPHPFASIR